MAAPHSRAALLGDVDGDGRVTVADALRLLRVAAGRQEATGLDRVLGDLWPPCGSPHVVHYAWTTGDGRITSADAAQVLRIALGLRAPQDIGPVAVELAGGGPAEIENVSATSNGAMDGPASQVRLFDPWDLAVAPSGDIYFTENAGNRVRVLQTDGMVRTLAGNINDGFYFGHSDGPRDGTGTQARFHRPAGIALLPDGSLVVGDLLDHAIRRVTTAGVVTTLAGTGVRGYRDGPAQDAQFDEPNGVATDPAGNIYIADSVNQRIRKLTPDGRVTTLAGDGHAGFKDGPALQAEMQWPVGLCYDRRDGSLYIADMFNHAIRQLTPAGRLITIAGNGTKGFADGTGAQARFRMPYGLDLDAQGRLWIADWGNERVRVMQPDGRVQTVLGSNGYGHVEGPGNAAKFSGLMNVRVGPEGRLYLADTDNERIEVVMP